MTRTITKGIATVGAAAAVGITSFLATSTQAQAAYGAGTVSATSLNVRPAPTTHSTVERTLYRGAKLRLTCWVNGQKTSGSNKWYMYQTEGNPPFWVSASGLSDINPAIKECDTGKAAVFGHTTAVLTQRSGPSTKDAATRTWAKGTKHLIVCKINSEKVGGNDIWYYLANGGWVSAKYVTNTGGIPQWCNRAR